MTTDDDREAPRRSPDPDAVRQAARSARRALTRPERAVSQARIADRLLGLPELQRPGRLALYLPTDGEVDLRALMAPLVRRGWELHLPVVGAERSMGFRAYRPDGTLVPNRYGIPEPVEAGDPDRTIADLDVVVVPCVAVDRSGRRLGFGAGYYDRALGRRGRDRTCVAVAVAFGCQLAAEVPERPWDVRMDLVVTESELIRPVR
jgi:5-formyltetrahydrofolate cyclo-ligase